MEIKRDIAKLGYSSKEFFDLPYSFEDGDSREILIAVGWLVSSQELIDVFILRTSHSFDEEYFKGHIDHVISLLSLSLSHLNFIILKNDLISNYEIKICNESSGEVKNFKKEFEKIDKNDFIRQLNYLKLLNGNLKFKVNGLYSSLMEKSRLTNQVNYFFIFHQFI